MKRNPVYADAMSEEAVGGAHALAKLLQWPCDGVLLDRNLPDLDAQEVAEQIRKQYPQIEVELVDPGTLAGEEKPEECETIFAEGVGTARNEPKVAELSDEAAGETESAVADAMEWESETSETVEARREVDPLPGMIGSSRAMAQVYRLVQMVAKRDTTVLVTGETGTGKELVAGAVHSLSRRAKHPFVVVNCAAIPESLLEAELFGHARGAFTGAVQSRLGRIHVAQGGTLFLDEVGELPLSMQAKLLRFLQSGEVQRLGSSDVYRVDVRVVCATNVKLLELTRARQFRLDLYYRLAIFPVVIPPLRERLKDVRPLAEHFLEKLSAESEMPRKYLSAAALQYLEKAEWPGNVRELQHAIERAFILAGNDLTLGVGHFQPFSDYSN
ncbi:MAG TPA: sigma-54 dependent transcriptional regulator [Candidatus Acidoferrum sp.]|jgi:transcriptional regulator with GAF, ATPase, and Fis domain